MGVSLHATCIEWIREPIDSNDRFLLVFDEDPVDFLRAERFCGNARLRSLGNRQAIGRDSETVSAKYDWTGKGLQLLLILKLKLCPVCRADCIADTNLIDIANIIIVVVPTADVESRRGLDRQRCIGCLRGVAQFAIDVYSRIAFFVSMENVGPLVQRDPAKTRDIRTRKIAFHFNMRRAFEMHDDLALTMLVAPSEHTAVGSLRTNPSFRRVRLRTDWITFDLLTT